MIVFLFWCKFVPWLYKLIHIKNSSNEIKLNARRKMSSCNTQAVLRVFVNKEFYSRYSLNGQYFILFKLLCKYWHFRCIGSWEEEIKHFPMYFYVKSWTPAGASVLVRGSQFYNINLLIYIQGFFGIYWHFWCSRSWEEYFKSFFVRFLC